MLEIPRVSTWPAVQQFVSGSTIHVACTAVAFPPPTFAWRFGDSGQMVETQPEGVSGRGDIPVEDVRRISTDHEGLLTIRNASRDDAGRWECIATNDQGVGSDVARLQYIGEAPFTLEINFEILFRNKNFQIFLAKVSTFTLEINFRKPYMTIHIVVCEYWPTDQSQRSTSEIFFAKFRKIEHVVNCKIEFRNLFLSKVDCSR